MFEAFVVTLREGVEAALICAIVFTYLRKVGRADLIKSVYIGIAAAVALSLLGGFLVRRLEISEDLWLEGWGMLIGSIFVATMVIWMWRTARGLKGEIETRIGQIAGRSKTGFSFGVFAFVFLMIGREGIETVLFLGAVQLNTTAVMNFIGGLTGLVLAIVIGILFVKGSIRINLRKFFSITSIILIVVAIQLFISGLHGLSEALVLPSSDREMAIIGPIVKNNVFFYLIILGMTALMILLQRGNRAAEPSLEANPAERRKALHHARRERLWTRSLAAVVLISMVMITTQFVYSSSGEKITPPERIFNQGQQVRIATGTVNDGGLHRFAYQSAGPLIRFILIKLDSGRIGVAFDACQICGDKGYFQQGPQIICKNCTAAINPASIGQSGGCNPIELKSRTEASDIVIESADLEAGAASFTSGK
jgi:high-affinity iron transporter